MIKHVHNRIIVKVDIDGKNWHIFSNGVKIRLERNTDNFDLKYTAQNLGIVIDGENIPKDAIVLFHHNSIHETYQVFNHSSLSGEDVASGIKIYSIMERDVFFWKMPNDEQWNPTKHFDTALRVFEPYTGRISFITPKLIKDTLFITSGKYKGLCCRTLEASDYMITFLDPTTGKDQSIIRLRPDGNEEEQREPEVVAIDHDLTEKINNGEILVGLSTSDCKMFHESNTLLN